MINKENQHLKDYELLIVFILMTLTILTYGSFTRHIFVSEKISPDQIKAEILAYQAAQIYLLKNVKKPPLQLRSLASERTSFDGLIGEDSHGKPFRFQITQEREGILRVLLSQEGELPSDATEAVFDVVIDLSEKT